jgi:hypothetical protein|tara:strand:+ start:655 stop:843 length:189 start_codon:yes stop_codon:yes gene_type:complete
VPVKKQNVSALSVGGVKQKKLNLVSVKYAQENILERIIKRIRQATKEGPETIQLDLKNMEDN